MLSFIKRARASRRMLTRAGVAVLGVALLTGIAAGPALAGTAPAGPAAGPAPVGAGAATPAAYQPGTAKAILGTGGAANAFLDGLFAGIVYLDPNLYWAPANRWIESDESWTGPGSYVYRTYRLNGSDRCLTHQPVNSPSQGMLFIQTCNWWDNSQWWAVDHVFISHPSCPTSFCTADNYADILMPWDAYGQAATVLDGTIILAPRGGTKGFPAQRFTVIQLPKIPQ